MQPQFITLSKSAKDITGQRFGRWIALGPIGKNARREIIWLCQCDCGNIGHIAGHSLTSGNSQSCGCLNIDKIRHASTTHGMSLTPLFQTWYKIIERCTNPSNRNYHQYGARGITICDEWRNSFLEFHKYASQLDHFGEKGYSIDRINNSLGYQPENIRYATQHQQSRNKRTNVMITHSGETKCLKDWASSVNMSVGTLQRRIKLGWPTDKVLTQRPRKMNTTK